MDDGNNAVVNGADLALLDISDKEAVMEVRDNFGNVLKHPDGRPFTITLYSRDSDKFVDLARKLQDTRMQQSLRTRMPTFALVSDRDTVELLVAVTKSWDIVLNGENPPSTPEAYRSAYTRIRRLREQVDEFLGNPANFTTG
jgi:hypothetical protein